MNGRRDTSEATTADEGDGLDPRQAATLLEHTKRDAQRQFEINSPLLSVIQAGVVLAGYGAIWLSVRGQHPYAGPDGTALVAVYTAVIVAIVISTRAIKRATTGVSGRSLRQRRAEIATLVTAYIAVAVFQGALKYDGASNAIVYGVFPAAAPMLVVGATAAGMAAVREEWPKFGSAIFVVALAAGSPFAGPDGVWLIIGLGLFLAIVAHAAATAWLRRA